MRTIGVMTGFADRALLAERKLRELFPPTPLQRNDHLSARYGAEIWLKREDLSPVRSYKLRGASNAMRKVLAEAPERSGGLTETRALAAEAAKKAREHLKQVPLQSLGEVLAALPDMLLKRLH